jgi:hypothetical protein
LSILTGREVFSGTRSEIKLWYEEFRPRPGKYMVLTGKPGEPESVLVEGYIKQEED